MNFITFLEIKNNFARTKTFETWITLDSKRFKML